jgi:chromosome segregation ATPase
MVDTVVTVEDMQRALARAHARIGQLEVALNKTHDDHLEYLGMLGEAADRIEQLEAELRKAKQFIEEGGMNTMGDGR